MPGRTFVPTSVARAGARARLHELAINLKLARDNDPGRGVCSEETAGRDAQLRACFEIWYGSVPTTWPAAQPNLPEVNRVIP